MFSELILEICNSLHHYSYLVSFLPIALLLVISALAVPASWRSPQSQYTLIQGDKGLQRAEGKEPIKAMDTEKVHMNKEESISSCDPASQQQKPMILQVRMSKEESTSSCDPASQKKPMILRQGLRRSLSYEEPCSKVKRQGGLVEEKSFITRGGGHVKPFMMNNSMALHVERKPSLTGEEVKELADAFIARVRQSMRAQRQESYKRRQETTTLERQDSHEIYKARIDRSAGY